MQYTATKGQNGLKEKFGIPASALECTWCDRAQLRSNASSKIDRTPRRPVSRAVALAGPSFHRFQPYAVAITCVRSRRSRAFAYISAIERMAYDRA
jgi:hypothetical protein